MSNYSNTVYIFTTKMKRAPINLVIEFFSFFFHIEWHTVKDIEHKKEQEITKQSEWMNGRMRNETKHFGDI